MKNSDYMPQPVNLDDQVLPEELCALSELIAKNVHDVWAKGRLDEGWSYGPERNDADLKHPCLVPYDQLPENEKQFDRNTAESTLKLIMSLGFEISKKTISQEDR